jgi:hypothetical protein
VPLAPKSATGNILTMVKPQPDSIQSLAKAAKVTRHTVRAFLDNAPMQARTRKAVLKAMAEAAAVMT